MHRQYKRVVRACIGSTKAFCVCAQAVQTTPTPQPGWPPRTPLQLLLMTWSVLCWHRLKAQTYCSRSHCPLEQSTGHSVHPGGCGEIGGFLGVFDLA
jgi:hypothetical protein